MANQEHLDILKQGVDVWNKWRQEHQRIKPDLSGADLWLAFLRGADLRETILIQTNLSGANLSGANLREAILIQTNLVYAILNGADLSKADLREADFGSTNIRDAILDGADLSKADLRGAILIQSSLRDAILSSANLSKADLSKAELGKAELRETILIQTNLSGANLSGANLNGANLNFADLSRTDLRETILIQTNLSGANLNGANLREAILSKAQIGWTSFGDHDLRVVKGLETVEHEGPSPLSINTIYLSQGDIPEVFLRGTGIPGIFIEYIHSLVGKAIEYYSCFISYSSKDEALARRLYADLQSQNVRCWFAPEDLKWGDKIRTGIDEAIRLHDKLLLILSKSSVASGWVEHEVKSAFAKERKEKRTVLFPVRVDNSVFESPFDWATEIRHERNIGDFTRWKNHDDYEKALNRLLHDLKAEAQKMGSPDATTNDG